MLQRTLGFKIFRNVLYSPNKTRMVKRDAEIENSLTGELAGFVVQQLVFGTERENCGLVPVCFRCLGPRRGGMCPESIKHNLSTSRVECLHTVPRACSRNQ